MKRYIAGIGLCCALAACNESYPGLYAPVYDADNPNPEMTADSIPVTLSLTDPAYALVTGKRGQGSFGFWDDEEERAKWMAAEFGVYAFLTRNHVYDGTPALTADETSTGGGAPLCLVNDRKARISAACELLWADASRRITARFTQSINTISSFIIKEMQKNMPRNNEHKAASPSSSGLTAHKT